VLRLLRLLRVFRLVKALPRLRSIVESLIQGFTSVVWIIILMSIFNYIMGCLGMLLFAELDPFYYRSVLQSLFTTYQVGSGNIRDITKLITNEEGLIRGYTISSFAHVLYCTLFAATFFLCFLFSA